MKTIKNIVITLLLTVSSTLIFAQESPLETLRKLEGKWSGKGWINLPNGTTETFNQKETIEFRLNDNVLLINGRGFNQKTNEQTFEALAIMYLDKDGKIKMTSHTMDGKHTIATVEPNETGYTWWFTTPNGGKIVYEMNLSNNIWVEKGSYSPDGNQSYPFMEMTLTKDSE